jgi:hypothetical protein
MVSDIVIGMLDVSGDEALGRRVIASQGLEERSSTLRTLQFSAVQVLSWQKASSALDWQDLAAQRRSRIVRNVNYKSIDALAKMSCNMHSSNTS